MSAPATRLGIEPRVCPTAILEDVSLGRYVEVGDRTKMSHSSFGDYSYIMEDGHVLFSIIGKFCSIAAAVRINAPNHPTWRASQHHFTYRSADYFDGAEPDRSIFEWRRKNSVVVGNDVWIGHGATILPGVTIGDGAVVAAGAVVSKHVAAYQMVGGVPGKVIKPRFPPEMAVRLQRLAWWDWEHDDIHAALADFRDMPADSFLEKHEARQGLGRMTIDVIKPTSKRYGDDKGAG